MSRSDRTRPSSLRLLEQRLLQKEQELIQREKRIELRERELGLIDTPEQSWKQWAEEERQIICKDLSLSHIVERFMYNVEQGIWNLGMDEIVSQTAKIRIAHKNLWKELGAFIRVLKLPSTKSGKSWWNIKTRLEFEYLFAEFASSGWKEIGIKEDPDRYNVPLLTKATKVYQTQFEPVLGNFVKTGKRISTSTSLVLEELFGNSLIAEYLEFCGQYTSNNLGPKQLYFYQSSRAAYQSL